MTMSKDDGLEKGEKLKQQGMAKADNRDGLEEVKLAFKICVLKHAIEHGIATSDDGEADLCKPRDKGGKWTGGAMSALAKSGALIDDGTVKTCRPLAHARRIGKYKLRSADKAREMIREFERQEAAIKAASPDAPTSEPANL